MAVIITALRCPDCGEALDGHQRDVVFCCPVCRVGHGVEAGVMTAHRVHEGVAVEDVDGRRLLLPFWKVSVSVPDTGFLSDLDGVWVSAFHMTRPAFFGDPGVDLTERRALPLEAEPDGEPLVLSGITRSAEQAERYCRLWVRSVRERLGAPDDALEVGAIELWALPFAYRESEERIVSLVSGVEYVSALVEDLSEVLG